MRLSHETHEVLLSCYRLNPPPAAEGQKQVMKIYLFDPVAGFPEWNPNSVAEQQRQVLWTSEPITLVSAEGQSQPIDQVHFRFPSNFGFSAMSLVAGITLAWTYDYSHRMGSLSHIKPAKNPSAVRIKYVTGSDDPSVGVGEREILPTGWTCAFCQLGDLGGKEELHTHYSIFHRGECEVEAASRETVSWTNHNQPSY